MFSFNRMVLTFGPILLFTELKYLYYSVIYNYFCIGGYCGIFVNLLKKYRAWRGPKINKNKVFLAINDCFWLKFGPNMYFISRNQIQEKQIKNIYFLVFSSQQEAKNTNFRIFFIHFENLVIVYKNRKKRSNLDIIWPSCSFHAVLGIYYGSRGGKFF